jgi:peptidoglycan/xylan/chitin deacetylase (PgdA/CDA1 family)
MTLPFLVLPVRAAQERKYVALTFDDGPSGKYTRALLDGLYDRGAKATFLLCGYRIKDYPDLAQRMLEEGHEIGHHGYSHDYMKGMSRRQIAQELMDTENLLPEGCHPAFLRPPGGLTGDAVQQVAQARGLAILHWSVDPHDWEIHSKASIEKAVLEQVHDGDIILLHDMTMSSVRAALDIVDALHRRGFRFVTVSQLAKIKCVDLKPGQVYRNFP